MTNQLTSTKDYRRVSRVTKGHVLQVIDNIPVIGPNLLTTLFCACYLRAIHLKTTTEAQFPTSVKFPDITKGAVQMCDLCSKDEVERKRGRDNQFALAERLKSLAYSLQRLGFGSIKPHTDEAKQIEVHARGIIRDLVGEWL